MGVSQAMTSQTLTYAAPAASLSRYASFFYDFQSFTGVLDDVDLADYAQLRFILKGHDGVYNFIDGHKQVMPDAHVVGPTTGNTHVSGLGDIHVFGVGLLPAGWGAIMPMDASNAVNRVFDAAELFGPMVTQARRELCASANCEERVAIGNHLIERLVAYENTLARDFTTLVDDWLAGSLSPDVEALVSAAGVSRRRVERNCNRYYGAPPKLLARKYRATRAAVRLAKGEANADDLIEHGFYDQSHFIRELKYFTGLTPTTIQENLPTLTKLTIRRTEHRGISPLAESTSPRSRA